MGKVILPKTYVQIDAPLIFLAGPIRSAPNWHDEAISFLLSKEPDLIIASPTRQVGDPIKFYLVKGDEGYFPRQRAWERHYLDIASKMGSILFWLPGEAYHNCNKVYGAMTRLELGQWMTRYSLNKDVRLCIGTDGKFPEMDTINFDLKLDASDKTIFSTLEETCTEALRLSYHR